MMVDPTHAWIARVDLALMAAMLLIAARDAWAYHYPAESLDQLPQRWTQLRCRHVTPVAVFVAPMLVLLAFAFALTRN